MRKTKVCGKCKQEKSVKDFWKDNYPLNKTGLRSFCKECSRVSVRKWRKTKVGTLKDRYYQIVRRCTNPRCSRYKDYGGRGIKCLFKSANEFVDYVVNELQADPRGLQIDRINNNGHYEKGNIRFVTCKENCKNKEQNELDKRFRKS